jgi:hypothetical protein
MPVLPGDTPMTIAGGQQINTHLPRWNHCVTRCVRRALPIGEVASDRKAWITHRIGETA